MNDPADDSKAASGTPDQTPMLGSAGWQACRDVMARMAPSRQLMSKGQKLRLSALQRAIERHDLLGDWRPLFERAFALWEGCLGVPAGGLSAPAGQPSSSRTGVQ